MADSYSWFGWFLDGEQGAWLLFIVRISRQGLVAFILNWLPGFYRWFAETIEQGQNNAVTRKLYRYFAKYRLYGSTRWVQFVRYTFDLMGTSAQDRTPCVLCAADQYESVWITNHILEQNVAASACKLLSNEGNKYPNNTRVSAETVHHENTYIILFLHDLTNP